MRAFIDIISEQLLTEIEWKDFNKTARTLAKFPGKFVHFSSVEKIGVNPKKSHSDPHGIYGYPIDWLLATEREAVQAGRQYGLTMRYFFVFDVRDDGRGIVLSTVTWEDVKEIAGRNGWLALLEEARGELAETMKKALPFYVRWDHPGSFIWHFCDYLQRNNKGSWNKLLKGITYIYDDNNSIINNNEPHQIVVLDPRAVVPLYKGINEPGGNDGKHDRSDRAIVDIFNRFLQHYPGKVTYQRKNPTLTMQVGETTVSVSYAFRNTNASDGGSIKFRAQTGDQTAKAYLSGEKVKSLPVDRIEHHIQAWIEEAVEVVIPETALPVDELALLLKNDILVADHEVTISKEVARSLGDKPNGHTHVYVKGDADYSVDEIPVGLRAYTAAGPDSTHLGVRLMVADMKNAILSGDTDYDLIANGPEDLLDNVAKSMAFRFKQKFHDIGPDRSRYALYYSNFTDQTMLAAFIGWILEASGLTLGGYLQRHMTPEAMEIPVTDFRAVYRDYEDKDYLHYKISSVLQSRK